MADKKRGGRAADRGAKRAPDIPTRLARHAADLAADPEHPGGDEALALIDRLIDEGRGDRLDAALRAADELGIEAFERLRELIEHAATHVAVSTEAPVEGDGGSDAAAADEAGNAVREARLYAVVFVGPRAAMPDEFERSTGEALVDALRTHGLVAEDADAAFAASLPTASLADALDWTAVSDLAAELFDAHVAGDDPPPLDVEPEDPADTATTVRLLPFAIFESPETEPALESADASEAETAWLTDCAGRLSADFESELDVIGVFPWFGAVRMAAIVRRALGVGDVLADIDARHGRGPSALGARLSVIDAEDAGLVVRLGLDDADDRRRLATADFPVLANEHVEDAWAAIVDALVEQGVPEPD